ncbi:type II toxin-antitoxin system RatA family toxin [Porticoccus sp. W117]|uniref:type II toxin-antitoxin system RatA family toxin n=1 Tax=Porticoccus sp. W117 TaxID=3054777 RepID=UPI002591BED6|nr:type II toxin-antitoxin system RatA family toxin [Porticoccus sp. W117]MDM3871329.1 type II toxin-antitoxin system RatA family toxin [Porticoccus sp. W117]
MSTTIERSALVMHPAEGMFDLVNDVAAYPEFMDGCVGATILASDEKEMVAQLVLRRAGVEQRFTTRNQLQRPERIALALEEGPFTALNGLWRFDALNDSACKVSLTLTFEFKNSALAFAAGKLFSQVANNLVGSLCQRADEVYTGEL